jgi:hypothetical protein
MDYALGWQFSVCVPRHQWCKVLSQHVIGLAAKRVGLVTSGLAGRTRNPVPPASLAE